KNTDYIKKVVVGPGFRNRRELEIINKKSKHKFELIDGLKNISNLILEASVIFTAGGDTLYEAACIGTPAIVLWEDIHEKKQADWFTREGSAINLGQGTVVEGKKIEEITIRLQNNADKWIKMSNSGKRIIDGKGIERIVKIIRSSIPN
ncbi:MAG: glycosyltransferase, partial [SAR202 cluster bacterium]|nr:glycosyltransferase [SAR202 cluster bacterium]